MSFPKEGVDITASNEEEATMAVQLADEQKQAIYQCLAARNLEGYQQVLELIIAGRADTALILSLIRSVWEEGKAAGYQDGFREGENHSGENALRLLKQGLENAQRNTDANPDPVKTGEV